MGLNSASGEMKEKDAVDGTTSAEMAMEDAPRVSVVMSVYNEEERVGQAVDSVLHQTFADFELIVVDDGSSDRTSTILEGYQQRDARIRVITQENSGLTRALIRGCAEASGEFIARQDADDWSLPTRLATQIQVLDDDHGIGFVSCTAQCVGPNDERLEQVSRLFAPAEATQKLLDERIGPTAHGSVLFRRSIYEAVGGYRAEFYFGQDADLWLRMAERSRIAYSPEVLYVFRRDMKAISGQMGCIQKQFGVLGQACRAARRAGLSDELILNEAGQLTNHIRTMKRSTGFSRGASSMAYLIGSTLVKQGHPSACMYLWQSIRFNPLNLRAWGRIAMHHLQWRHVEPVVDSRLR